MRKQAANSTRLAAAALAIALTLFGSSCSLMCKWCPEPEDNLRHVMIVWLNTPGNPTYRREVMAAGERLGQIRGVESVHVGQPVRSELAIVDDSFDVAIELGFVDRRALQDFLRDPEHQAIVRDSIGPLASRILVYDFW